VRWYKITCGGQTWDATDDPNALNVEIDIPVSVVNGPDASGGFVRVWGIPLSLILNAKSFNQQQVQVFGGMQKGLPLANPAEQGMLVQGNAFPVLGNWINTDMTLDIYIRGPFGNQPPPNNANIIHNWPKNQPLNNAIKNALQTAFPGFTPKINISSNLIRNFTDTGFYQTIGQYATYIYQASKSIMNNAAYLGVHMFQQGKTINVTDFTTPGAQKQVSPYDLIGQPIWTDSNKIQVKTVMRGDFHIGDTITLPKSLATLTQSSGTNVGSQASNIIQGSFLIQRMRHTGNFRQPDWASWCTTFDCITQQS